MNNKLTQKQKNVLNSMIAMNEKFLLNITLIIPPGYGKMLLAFSWWQYLEFPPLIICSSSNVSLEQFIKLFNNYLDDLDERKAKIFSSKSYDPTYTPAEDEIIIISILRNKLNQIKHIPGLVIYDEAYKFSIVERSLWENIPKLFLMNESYPEFLIQSKTHNYITY